MNNFITYIYLALAGAVIVALFIAYQMRKERWLETRGKRIVAEVTDVKHDKRRASTGVFHDFYSVTAIWTNPQTGHTYTFWKYIFDQDPHFTPGALVSVMIDPHNPHRYEIQI
ncbi:MAG TPA: hypothetical protein VNE38_00850 [Ktedonobacteraceae bacterium]|nr:hypothetical protein [Ktedonobacteraceae bacterium]